MDRYVRFTIKNDATQVPSICRDKIKSHVKSLASVSNFLLGSSEKRYPCERALQCIPMYILVYGYTLCCVHSMLLH
jgi:hypothetical protein